MIEDFIFAKLDESQTIQPLDAAEMELWRGSILWGSKEATLTLTNRRLLLLDENEEEESFRPQQIKLLGLIKAKIPTNLMGRAKGGALLSIKAKDETKYELTFLRHPLSLRTATAERDEVLKLLQNKCVMGK